MTEIETSIIAERRGKIRMDPVEQAEVTECADD